MKIDTLSSHKLRPIFKEYGKRIILLFIYTIIISILVSGFAFSYTEAKVPGVYINAGSTSGFNMRGFEFKSNQTGYIIGVFSYPGFCLASKGAIDLSNGTKLVEANYVDCTANFTTPFKIDAYTTYVFYSNHTASYTFGALVNSLNPDVVTDIGNMTRGAYNNGAGWGYDESGQQTYGFYYTIDLAAFNNPTPSDGQADNTQATFNISCIEGNVTLYLDTNADPITRVINNTTNPANYTTNVTSGTYYYKASCDGGATNTSIRTWYFDIIQPNATLNSNNYFNASNHSIDRTEVLFRLNMTFNDDRDLFAYKIEINSSDDVTYYNITNSSLSGTIYNFSTSFYIYTWPDDNYTAHVWVSDSHTAYSIPEYVVTKKPSELEFDTEYSKIRITSREASTPEYKKLGDRYEFGFDYLDNKISVKTFDIYCDGTLYRKDNTGYKGHMICSKDGLTGNWIDFEGVEGTPSISKVTDNHYTIAFSNMGDVQFKSIGGLNVVQQDYRFEVLKRILVDNCSEYLYPILNITYYDEVFLTPITASLTYDLSVYDGYSYKYLNGTYALGYIHSFCSAIPPSNPVDYDISGNLLIKKDLYATRYINIPSIIPLQTSNNPTLVNPYYLISLTNSSTVNYNWFTTAYQPISGTLIIYKCNGDGSQTLVESTPIVDSKAVANIELLNTPYSYNIVYNDITYSDSSFSACHIESEQTLTYYVDISETGLTDYISLFYADCNVSKPASDRFLVEWNPSLGYLGCIFVRRDGNNGYVTTDTICTTNGTVTGTIPSTGYNYRLDSKLYSDGYSKECESLSFVMNKDAAELFGLAGIFAVVLLISTLMLIFAGDNELMLILGGLGIVISWIFGLTKFGWLDVSLMIAFLVVIAYIGRKLRYS